MFLVRLDLLPDGTASIRIVCVLLTFYLGNFTFVETQQGYDGERDIFVRISCCLNMYSTHLFASHTEFHMYFSMCIAQK